MVSAREIRESLLHVLFPEICAGCGNELFGQRSSLCIRCIDLMPSTNFEAYAGNPVEKKFYGRLPLVGAAASFYFGSHSMMQQLMHGFKYRGNRELGLQLGTLMGLALAESKRFQVDALVPLPLHKSRERRRGFNQSAILAEGIAENLGVPVLGEVITRSSATDTQTRRGRIDRWLNMEGRFQVVEPGAVSGKHLLLVDDVVTTGATLEACGAELLQVEGVRLSIATLCYANR
jgi:ComF family protein